MLASFVKLCGASRKACAVLGGAAAGSKGGYLTERSLKTPKPVYLIVRAGVCAPLYTYWSTAGVGSGELWGGAERVWSPCSLTLKRNKKVCVAPEAPWIQLLIHKLTQTDVSKKEAAAVARSRGEAGRQPPVP